MDIQTKDLNWDNGQKIFTSGSIIYGGNTYKFEWNDTEYVINGPPSSSSSDFDEAKLIEALKKEFKM
jgi:hypothetical protein